MTVCFSKVPRTFRARKGACQTATLVDCNNIFFVVVMATWRGLSVSVVLLISTLSLSISCSYFDSWTWLNVNCMRLSALHRSGNLPDDVSGSFKTRLWSSTQRTSFTFDLDICILFSTWNPLLYSGVKRTIGSFKQRLVKYSGGGVAYYSNSVATK